MDGVIQWMDQTVRNVVSGVQNTGQRVVNWLKDGRWVTNEEKLQIAVGAAYAYIEEVQSHAYKAAMEEYARQAKEEVLESFYKDTREKTDAKIYALKAAGIDTADVEAEVARRRKAIEERKKQKSDEQQGKMDNQQHAAVGSIFDSFYTVIQKGMRIIESLLLRKDKQDPGFKNGINEIGDGLVEAKVTPDEIKQMTMALNQGENMQLHKTIEKLVKDERIGKEVDALKLAKHGCVFASLYVDLVLAGAKVEDIGSFIERWYKAGAIKADGTTYQDTIAKAYGYELQRITDYNEFTKIVSNGAGIQHGTLRIGKDPNNWGKGHNVNMYNYNGGGGMYQM